jgi:OCT family organic cation transporter-like MFS transporter 4/5
MSILPNKIYGTPKEWVNENSSSSVGRLVVALVYYGLSLSANKLKLGVYLDFLLLSLCEFPACALCILLFNRIGRKKLHIMFMGVGGLACIATAISKLKGNA